MIEADLAFAFSAGLLAAFNPCGFAMLPAYIAWFLGADTGAARPGALRSLAVGASVSLGFVAVYGVAGVVIHNLSTAFSAATPYFAIVVGLAVLVPLGVANLLGRPVKVPIPRFERAASGTTLPSMVLFGVSYATISMSCGLGPFLAAVSGTFSTGNLASALAVLGAFVAGMGAVMMSLTLALGMAKTSLVGSFRRVLPHVERASGALMVAAGLYVAYYGWYSLALNAGGDVAAGPVAWFDTASTAVSRWFARTGEVAVGFVLVGVVTLGLALGWWRRRRIEAKSVR